jgi:hypothetical protein
MSAYSITPRFEEPLHRTLARTTLARTAGLAVLIGAVFALQRHHLALLLPIAALALWFTLGGHVVEIIFLNRLRDQIPQGRSTQVLVRLLLWLSGGILLYLGMAATARTLAMAGPPFRLWWIGGCLLIAVELVAHAALAMRGRPNVYNGLG